jgi:hypothetical protein
MSVDWANSDRAVNINSKTDVAEAFESLRGAAQALSKAGKLQGETLETMTGQLEEVVKRQAEIDHATRQIGTVGQTGDAELSKRYATGKGDGIRLARSVESVTLGDKVIKVERPGLLDDEHRSAAQDRLQAAVGRRALARMVLKNAETPVLDGEVARAILDMPAGIRDQVARAVYNDTASFNYATDPAVLASVFRTFAVPSTVESLFETVAVSSNTWSRPKESARARPYIKGNITTDSPANFTPSSPTVANSAMTMTGLAARVLVDEDLVEDSVIPLLSWLQDEMQMAIVEGREDSIINGDTAATHQDAVASWNIRSRWGAAGLGGSADHRRAYLGLRARAYDASNTTDQTAAKTYAGYLTARAKMGERAVGKLVNIMSPEYYIVASGFSELLTMEKMGNQASILTGQVAALAGDPVVISRFVSSDLAVTGLYTGSSTTTGFLIVDTSAYKMFVRRAARYEMERKIGSGHYELVISDRSLFDSHEAATVKNVHWSYNL